MAGWTRGDEQKNRLLFSYGMISTGQSKSILILILVSTEKNVLNLTVLTSFSKIRSFTSTTKCFPQISTMTTIVTWIGKALIIPLATDINIS